MCCAHGLLPLPKSILDCVSLMEMAETMDYMYSVRRHKPCVSTPAADTRAAAWHSCSPERGWTAHRQMREPQPQLGRHRSPMQGRAAAAATAAGGRAGAGVA